MTNKPTHENAAKKKSNVAQNEESQAAFQKLKQLCSDTPVLAYANYTKPFHVHTGANELGLGVVLYQKQGEGTNLVVVFASQMLSKLEWQNDAHKLKFLALKW